MRVWLFAGKEEVNHKIPGCCSICDQPAFEVMAVWDAGEKRAGEPKRLGGPLEGTTRITFLLLNGRRTDMTFCGECSASLAPENYQTLWRKNLAGYLREQDGNPEKFKDEFANGILAEMGRVTWKELIER